MTEAEGDELLAHNALLTPADVVHDPLHLATTGALARPIPALSSMHQDLNEALDGSVECLLGVLQARSLVWDIQVHPQACHGVLMTILLIAANTKVEVLHKIKSNNERLCKICKLYSSLWE